MTLTLATCTANRAGSSIAIVRSFSGPGVATRDRSKVCGDHFAEASSNATVCQCPICGWRSLWIDPFPSVPRRYRRPAVQKYTFFDDRQQTIRRVADNGKKFAAVSMIVSMSGRPVEDDEMPAEIDFSAGLQSLNRVSPSAKVFLPTSIERGRLGILFAHGRGKGYRFARAVERRFEARY